MPADIRSSPSWIGRTSTPPEPVPRESPSTNGAAAAARASLLGEGKPGLRREPTWARNINFDGGFDLTASPPLPRGASDGVRRATEGFAGSASGSPRAVSGGLASVQTRPRGLSWDALRSSPMPNEGTGAAPSHARVASQDSAARQPERAAPRQAGSSGAWSSPSTSQPAPSERSTPRAAGAATMDAPDATPQQGKSRRFVGTPPRSEEWARTGSPSFPGSSADAYAQRGDSGSSGVSREAFVDINGLPIPGASRPSTSMSRDSSRDAGRELRRDSNGTSGSAGQYDVKRASVMSFQTALSGSYPSNHGTHSPSHLDERLQQLEVGPPIQPWVQSQTQNVYGSSPDSEAALGVPGGWAGRGAWAPTPPPKTNGLLASPRQAFSPLAGGSSRMGSRVPSQSATSTLGSRSRSASASGSAVLDLGSSPGLTAAPHDAGVVETTEDLDDVVISRPDNGENVHRDQTVRPTHSRSSSRQLQDVARDLPLPHQPSRDASFASQEAATVPSDLPIGASGPGSYQRRASGGRLFDDTGRRASGGRLYEGPSQDLRARLDSSLPPSPAAYESRDAPGPVPPSKDAPRRLSDSRQMQPGVPAAAELSDNVIPPPLPASVVAASSRERHREFVPVPDEAPTLASDFRRAPLAKINTSALGDASAAPDSDADALRADAANKPQSSPVDLSTPMGRRSSSGQMLPRAALVEAPVQSPAPLAEGVSRASSPSVETPPREPSPPPEGEVEARAEWERAQAKQLAAGSKNASKSANAARKSTFRGSMKPLQMVPAAEAAREDRSAAMRGSASYSPIASLGALPLDSPQAEVIDPMQQPNDLRQSTAPVTDGPLTGDAKTKARTSSGVLSTQQLQRQQARDQRRSVGAINMVMGATGDMAGGANGPYPSFPSPSTSATKVRQYPGTLPQRSLVAPFELQQRPDGLLSGLIGPDGVRRSPNDPEVCLECMMRDEDMIDVHVLGASLWERESDRDFREACKIEAEEDARKEREREARNNPQAAESASADHSSAPRENIPLPPRPTGARVRVKRVAKGDPLTAERLKLHTQMNPPASSHRWRTLQTFLAIQAKYIAMEQRARANAGLDRDLPQRPSPHTATASSVVTPDEYDNKMVRTGSGGSPADLVAKLSSKNRGQRASAGLLVEEQTLAPADREAKERDIAHARDARRNLAASTAEPSTAMLAGSRASYGAAAKALPQLQQFASAEDERKRLSGQPLDEQSAGHASIPRRSAMVTPTPMRVGSAQDLRSIQGAMHGTPNPSSPASLAPPTRPFAQGGSSAGNSLTRANSSLSLAQSGSMVDMHLGLEDRLEHRVAQQGFMPGSPLGAASPGALNRAYYGFPGDGDEPVAPPAPERQPQPSYPVPDEREVPQETSRGRKDSIKKKKKGGLRGFLSKLAGGGGSSSDRQATPSSIDFSRDSSSRRSPSLSSTRNRRTGSLGPDISLDMAPSHAQQEPVQSSRASTSGMLGGTQATETDHVATPGVGDVYHHPPGMTSQTSFDMMIGGGGLSGDMGPFQTGPLPPPRHDSRLPPESPAAEEAPAVPTKSHQSSAQMRQSSSSALRSMPSGSQLNNTAPGEGRREAQGAHDGAPVPASPAASATRGTAAFAPQRTSSRDASSRPLGRQEAGYAQDVDQASVASSRTSRREQMQQQATPMHTPIVHGRMASGGVQDARSGYAPSGNNSFPTSPSNSSALQFDGRRSMNALRGAASSSSMPAGSAQPKRPPRNPQRDTASENSAADHVPPLPSSIPWDFQQPQQPPPPPPHYYQTGSRVSQPPPSRLDNHQALPPRAMTPHRFFASEGSDAPTPATEKRKSRFKLPSFGKQKRESHVAPKAEQVPLPRRGSGDFSRLGLGLPPFNPGTGAAPQTGNEKARINFASWANPTLRSRSSRTTVDDLAGLAPPKPGFGERLRAISTPIDDRGLPPRSQSAMGKLPSQRFVGGGFPGFRSRSRMRMREEESEEDD